MDLPEFKTRVSVIGDPLSSGGLAYAFRKHARNPWTLPKLINTGSITPLAAGLLSFLMDGQSSVLVAGGVGSGKTSLLCALLLEIPQKYRILTIEDTPELPIENLQKLGCKIQGMNTKVCSRWNEHRGQSRNSASRSPADGKCHSSTW